MEPIAYLELARRLQESDIEADSRTAVSRAYYCAYLESLWLDKVLSNHGNIPTGAGSHQQISSKFKNYPRRNPPDDIDESLCLKVSSLGYLLVNLHGQRTRADYDHDDLVGKADAATAIKGCEKILERLNEIREELAKQNPELLARAGGSSRPESER